AELAGGKPIPTGKGDINVSLGGGAMMVIGDASARLSATPDVTNGGHLRVMVAPSDGAPPGVLPQDRLGGTLGGLLDARDGALLNAEKAVDTLAFDFANQVNTVHAAGFA